jgi:DNA polymerase (family 10)
MAISRAVDARVAFALAKKVVAELAPTCDRIEIAGSLRRNRPQVHDIDIVGLPSGNGSRWRSALEDMINRGSLVPVRGGDKAQCYIAAKTGIQVDIYRAEQRTWATLLLIRTGSREHNIRLAQRARELGLKLRASGDGVETGSGDLLDVYSEEEIFSLLKLPYLTPERRS